MKKHWYAYVTIRAALITGIFVILAAFISSPHWFNLVFSKDKSRPYVTVEPFKWIDTNEYLVILRQGNAIAIRVQLMVKNAGLEQVKSITFDELIMENEIIGKNKLRVPLPQLSLVPGQAYYPKITLEMLVPTKEQADKIFSALNADSVFVKVYSQLSYKASSGSKKYTLKSEFHIRRQESVIRKQE